MTAAAVGRPVDVDVPATRYAKTLDGGYIAYKLLGEGPTDIAIAGSIATNIEMFFEFEPAARFFHELASVARLSFHDRRGTGLSDDMGGLPNLETRAADLLAVLDAGRRYGAADDPRGRRRRDGRRAPGSDAPRPSGEPRLVPGSGPVGAGAGLAVRPPSRRRRGSRDRRRTAWGTPAFVERDVPLRRDGRCDPGVPRDDAASRVRAGAAVRSIRLVEEYDVRDVLPTLRLPVAVVAPRGLADDWIYEQATSDDRTRSRAMCHPLPPDAARLWHPAVIEETLAFCGVERPRPEIDTVLSTVLFTDIVGSTERQARGRGSRVERSRAPASRDRPRGARPLAGTVENDTAGDGFYATFDGPARAIRCAREVAGASAPSGSRCRAASTPESASCRGKCAGLTVSIGARVAAAAGPSEVVVSQTVRDLVAGSASCSRMRASTSCEGVPDRWRLYRVVG